VGIEQRRLQNDNQQERFLNNQEWLDWTFFILVFEDIKRHTTQEEERILKQSRVVA
jgi:hypothetical protein